MNANGWVIAGGGAGAAGTAGAGGTGAAVGEAFVDGAVATLPAVGKAEEVAAGWPPSVPGRSTAGVQAVRSVAMTASHVRRRAEAPVMV